MRIAYLKEIEKLSVGDVEPSLIEATRRYFSRKMPTGEYTGWVAVARPEATPERRGQLRSRIIGTAGIFSYDRPPASGGAREARLINVYVVDSWRGRGVAN